MKNILRNAVKHIQSVIIAALVVSLISLCGMYAYTENSDSASLPAFPDGHMHLLSKDASLTMKSGNSSFISPSFVFLTDTSGESYGNFGGGENSETVWTEFERVLTLLHDCDIEKKSFSDKQTAFEYIDDLYYARSKYYCEFANPLPLSAIAVFFENTYNDSIIYKESFFAKSMITTGDANGEVYLYVISEDGEVIVAKPKTALKFNYDPLENEADTELEKVTPTVSESARAKGITGLIPIFSGVKNIGTVYREDFLSKFNIKADSENVAAIVSAFGMNPNNTNRYTAHNGTVGFVEESGELKISLDGEITFDSDGDGGISMSKILGYLPSDIEKNTYGFTDTVGAVCSILESLGQTFLGGEASLVLESVAFDKESGLTSFGFGYCIGGLRIRSESDGEKDFDAYFSFSENALVKADVTGAVFVNTNTPYSDIPQTAALAAANSTPKTLTRLYAMYVSYNETEFIPEWMAEYAG